MYLEIDFKRFNPLKDETSPFWGYHEIPDIAFEARSYLKNYTEADFQKAFNYLREEIDFRHQEHGFKRSLWDGGSWHEIDETYRSDSENYLALLKDIDWYETDKLNPTEIKGYKLFAVLALAYLSHSLLSEIKEDQPAFLINAASAVAHAELLKFGHDYDLRIEKKHRKAGFARQKKNSKEKQKIFDYLQNNHDEIKNMSAPKIAELFKPNGEQDDQFTPLKYSTIEKIVRDFRKRH